jgi:poly-gamma-glutamate synthesis protein (capsule biosynthesis protein)
VRALPLLLLAWLFAGCRGERSDRPIGDEPRPLGSKKAPAPPLDSGAPSSDAARARTRLVVFAAGDVNLGREVGQRILRDASFDPFADLRPLLSRADLAFANLESPLSDQNGETQHPEKRLVFVGPPGGAALVARAPFHVVSVANNHVWDYGERGFLDTLDALDASGVRYAGATRRRGAQYEPTVLSVNGWSVALLAVTHIWNPGTFATHEARDRVAWADEASVVAAVTRARAEHDLVLVSYHGGREYSDVPAQEPLDFAKAVTNAGADAVLGHHPHVPQGVGWFSGRPVFFSLGNLVFNKYRDVAWTAQGFIARLTFAAADRSVEIAVCPYRIDDSVPRRAVASEWPGWDGVFRTYLRRTSSFASVAGAEVGEPDELGCLPLAARKG